MDACWTSFYLFCEHIGAKYTSEARCKLSLWTTLTGCGWWWPYDKLVIVTGRPSFVGWNNEEPRRIHADGRSAVEYPDGWKVWALNGVHVSQYVAETPAQEIDPSVLLREQNADIRREIVRKVGIERVLRALDAEVVDEQDVLYPNMDTQHYQLVQLDLGDGRKRPYLRMSHASMPKLDLVEGVHPDCDTVMAALRWRNQSPELPQWIS
jgi:hypothetical protein